MKNSKKRVLLLVFLMGLFLAVGCSAQETISEQHSLLQMI